MSKFQELEHVLFLTVSTSFGVYRFLAEFLELVEGDGKAGGVFGDLWGDGTHDLARDSGCGLGLIADSNGLLRYSSRLYEEIRLD